jgi:hypothetical protein
MTLRYRVTTFLALNLLAGAGCAGSSPESRGTLVAYARPSTDVAVTARSPELVVKVERIPEGALHDPAQMMDLRRSMERQIDAQVGRMPEARYRAAVRPRLAQALLAAGLPAADIDYILRGVDYHRAL